jgi:hypothetical protein
LEAGLSRGLVTFAVDGELGARVLDDNEFWIDGKKPRDV